MTADQPGAAGAAETVRHNLATLRRQRGLTQRDLARELADLGQRLHHVAIARIERGDRQVTVDELVALAAALDVSPLRLVLPLSRDETERFAVTPRHVIDGRTAWLWAEQLSPWWDDDARSEEIDPTQARYKAWGYLRLEPVEMGLSRNRGDDRVVDASGGIAAVLDEVRALRAEVGGRKRRTGSTGASRKRGGTNGGTGSEEAR